MAHKRTTIHHISKPYIVIDTWDSGTNTDPQPKQYKWKMLPHLTRHGGSGLLPISPSGELTIATLCGPILPRV